MPTVAFGPFPALSVRAANTLGQTLARMGLVQVTGQKSGVHRYKAESIPSAATIAANVTLEDMMSTRGIGVKTLEEIRAALTAAGAAPPWPAFPPAGKGTTPIDGVPIPSGSRSLPAPGPGPLIGLPPVHVVVPPVNIHFGEGRVIIAHFATEVTRGLMFFPSEVRRPVDTKLLGPAPPRPLQPGDLLFHFANVESAKALRLVLDDVISRWDEPAPSATPGAR